jgi:glucokinase
MSQLIAVDIGGTQLRAACYKPNSLTPLRIERTATRHSTETALERLTALVSHIWPQDEDVAAIGVAAPGPLDPYEGIVFEAPNIPGWDNLHLRDHLVECFKVPVAIGNDANLAALGEWKYGAGRGHHHLIYLTISTGIGGGVIVDDRLLLGVSGLAGELGHITVLPDGPLCGCGQRGHLEALASGPAIAAWVEQEIAQGVPSSLSANQTLTAKMVGYAAKNGDPLAIAAIERAGSYIGKAVADFTHIFNPSAVIIGGGVSQSGPLLLDPMRYVIKENVLSSQFSKDLLLTTAALGDEAGLVGALALAHTLIEN